MINTIGSGGMVSAQMTAMRGQMNNPFDKIDSNGDSSLDRVELSSFAEKISETTSQTVDVGQMMSRLDTNDDGLVNQEEFKAGRPEGPPPDMTGMMGEMGGPQGGGIQSFLDMLNSSEATSSNSIDTLDTNGDGIVDIEEARSGSNYLIQEYLSQTSNSLSQDSKTGSQLDLQA